MVGLIFQPAFHQMLSALIVVLQYRNYLSLTRDICEAARWWPLTQLLNL